VVPLAANAKDVLDGLSNLPVAIISMRKDRLFCICSVKDRSGDDSPSANRRHIVETVQDDVLARDVTYCTERRDGSFATQGVWMAHRNLAQAGYTGRVCHLTEGERRRFDNSRVLVIQERDKIRARKASAELTGVAAYGCVLVVQGSPDIFGTHGREPHERSEHREAHPPGGVINEAAHRFLIAGPPRTCDLGTPLRDCSRSVYACDATHAL